MKKRIVTLLLMVGLAAWARAAFVNDSAPAFTLPSLEGTTVSLSDVKGQVVLVNFWASWCPPCKQEFPELNELANEYKDQNFRLIAVNLDKNVDHVKKFLEKTGIQPKEMTILLDPKAEVVAKYVARSMPTSFIIDATGKIRFVHFGFNPKDPTAWRKEIDLLLKEAL